MSETPLKVTKLKNNLYKNALNGTLWFYARCRKELR